MFEIRLKVMLAVLMFALAIIVARLIDMQVVHADFYRQQAEDALRLGVKTIPAVRGSILDRTGFELASEEPCWDIKVDYGLLAMDSKYIEKEVKHCRRRDVYGVDLSEEEVERRLRADIDEMWHELAAFSGESVEQLLERANEICERIAAIHDAVEKRRGFSAPVREERIRHEIVNGLNDQEQVAARSIFGHYRWLSVEDSTQRVYHAGPAFAHILGRLAPVAAEHLKEDPWADDPLRKYHGSERLGVTGVERAAEHLLRGSRGRFQKTREDVIVESTPPVRGQDVHLSIRADLQDALYELFAAELAQLPETPGGSIVVLDVASREVLAMVSCPSYDPNRFQQDYVDLRDDTRNQPLRFRAVANQYAPGSIVKPLVCLAGLNTGKISLDTTFNCQGALFPEYPDRWRCWAAAGSNYRMHHGPLNAEGAIMHSCNIFMYHVGELLGVDTLCNYFDMVGFGKKPGTGLVEEVEGINPTPSWLESVAGHPATAGTARLFAIGQAEVSVTPVQAANLMAVYASGAFRHVTLIQEIADDRTWTLPGDDANWDAIRRGVYDVVNERGGTAYATAHISESTGYALCGKTGSAQAYPWPVSFSIPYVETNGFEGVAIVDATTRNNAIELFRREHKSAAFDFREVEIHERYPSRPPAQGRTHSHAWFAGFLQKLDSSGQPLWGTRPQIAFAVMVEFGGSGGRVSAPIGRKVAEALVEILGPKLDPDAPLAEEVGP